MANTLKLGSAINLKPLSSALPAPVAGDLYYDSTLGVIRFNDGTLWNEIQAANTDSYIKNNLGNNGITGYATYKNTAQSAPVDGTGGSPTTITFSTTSSGPLRGSNSFTFAKSAANGQGEGVSYAFNINSADQAKVMNIEFDYQVSSGTFNAGSSNISPSDVTVWIYDTVNGVLIQPSSISLFSNSSVTSDRFRSTFQTAYNSTSYRLILHIASTNSSAFTLKLDDITIKPSNYVYGTPISDWQSFTPTGGWNTNTTYTGRFRRVGDSMECYVSVATSGAPNAAGLTINLPSGYTIDTTKIAAPNLRQALGSVVILDSGLRVYVGSVAYNTSTSVFLAQTEAGANGITNTDPITFGSGDGVGIFFTVPILGWSSSVQMSNDADTRVVAMSNQTNLPTTASFGGSADIIWGGTPQFDTHGCYNNTTGQYRVPVSGYYRVGSYLSCSGTEATDARMILILARVSGGVTTTSIITETRAQNTGLTRLVADGSVLVYCLAGDLLSIRVDNDISGAAITSNNGNKFEVERLCGPAAIAASENIIATYTNSAGTVIANSGEIAVPFATKVVDTHGAFNGSIFTAPTEGNYDVTCTLWFASATYAATNGVYIVLYKNGSPYRYSVHAFIESASTQGVSVGLVATVPMLAGETLQIRVRNNRTAGSTALDAPASENYVTFKRVGT